MFEHIYEPEGGTGVAYRVKPTITSPNNYGGPTPGPATLHNCFLGNPILRCVELNNGTGSPTVL